MISTTPQCSFQEAGDERPINTMVAPPSFIKSLSSHLKRGTPEPHDRLRKALLGALGQPYECDPSRLWLDDDCAWVAAKPHYLRYSSYLLLFSEILHATNRFSSSLILYISG